MIGIKMKKIIAILLITAALAGCTTHVSSGVNYEYTFSSGPRIPVAHTAFGTVYH